STRLRSAWARSEAPSSPSSAADELRGWKQAYGWRGSGPASGGSEVRQRSVANAHLGANRHTRWGRRRSGGRPGIEYSSWRLSWSSWGIDASSASVYGWRTFAN